MNPEFSLNAFCPRHQGFRDVLQYAGFAKAIEKKLAPVKDITDYWENVPPVWQVR